MTGMFQRYRRSSRGGEGGGGEGGGYADRGDEAEADTAGAQVASVHGAQVADVHNGDIEVAVPRIPDTLSHNGTPSEKVPSITLIELNSMMIIYY
jgi:hypothetical protein